MTELRCPNCGSNNCECQPKPHVHRCLDCGYDGHKPKSTLDRLYCELVSAAAAPTPVHEEP